MSTSLVARDVMFKVRQKSVVLTIRQLIQINGGSTHLNVQLSSPALSWFLNPLLT
jgi:hypothetical protein